MSFDARLERAKLQDLRERQIEQAERPFAVLDRGGSSAQGFITEGSRGTAIDQFGQYSFRQRRFHVLDAITWRVSGAETTRNLLEIVWAYIPEITPQLQPANRPPGGVPPFLDPSAPRFLATMDPQGVARLQVFMQAVKARGIALPDPRVQAIPLKRVMDLMSPVPEIQSGACDVGPVPRAGGHPPHDKYATAVTGSTMDFMVRSPEGKDCQTDGLDRAGVTWEVKTGHLILAETRLGSLSEERLRQIADRVEEQRVRCLFATSRCGYPYVWAFTDPFVVEYFNELWGGTPRVVCRTEQGARC